MSYSKSSARHSYERFSARLLSLAKSTEKMTALTYEHKNLIYQSIIVLLSSAIEEYHKTFIEDWFYKLTVANVRMIKIHDNTKFFGLLHGTEQYYKSFLFDRDNEKETIKKLVTNKDVLKKYLDDSESFNIPWLARCVWSDKKYPSVKNITTLYNRLGIVDVFGVLSRLKHKDYKMQLNSFLSVRESIAHVGAGAVTYNDIKNHVSHIDELIYLLDKELYKHSCRVAGSVFWPNEQ